MSGSPLLIAVVLTLAWFAAANLVCSIASAIGATFVSDRVAADPRRARRLLRLRLLPAAAASMVSVVLFLPAHLWLEPPNTAERLGIVPLVFATVGLLLFLWSGWRIAPMVWASRRFVVVPWPAAEAIQWVEVPMLRGIALAGVFRPRVVVGSVARRALTPDELDVAIAHEIAHRRAGDNLTRALIRCAPDMFGLTASARRIEGLWNAEAECLADARATRGNPRRGACLASALIKVARLARDTGEPGCAPAWSMFHQPRLLETRVRLLVGNHHVQVSVGGSLPSLALAVALAIGLAWTAGVPHSLHWMTELVISLVF